MFRVDLARTCRRHGRAEWSRLAHVRGQLPARSLAPLQCRSHFAEREIEHVVQQEGSALERRQSVGRQEQRHGQILGQLRAAVGRERCRINNRLRLVNRSPQCPSGRFVPPVANGETGWSVGM